VSPEQNVLGLQVAVHDTALMGRVEGVGDGARQNQRGFGTREWPVAHRVRQSGPIDEQLRALGIDWEQELPKLLADSREYCEQLEERVTARCTELGKEALERGQHGVAMEHFDRVLASKMGVAAIEGLLAGKHDVMVGIRDNKIVYNDFNSIIGKHHEIDSESLRIAKILSI